MKLNQKILNYLKLAWRNVILFGIVDLLTASIMLIVLYLFGMIFVKIGQPFFVLKEPYVTNAFSLLGLLYLLSILLTSGWRHFKLINSSIKEEDTNVENSPSAEGDIEENKDKND